MAINVSSFINVDQFKTNIDKAIQQIKSGRVAPGFNEIHPPGGLEAKLENDYRRNGIPLNNVAITDLEDTAHALGIEPILDS